MMPPFNGNASVKVAITFVYITRDDVREAHTCARDLVAPAYLVGGSAFALRLGT